jgi:hypothetical protein
LREERAPGNETEDDRGDAGLGAEVGGEDAWLDDVDAGATV